MWSAPVTRAIAFAIADAFLAGEWAAGELVDRARHTLGSRARWIERVEETILRVYLHAPTDRPRELALYVEHVLGDLRDQRRLPRNPPLVRRWRVPVVEMVGGRWPVPGIGTTQELADYLGCSPNDLLWLADPKSLERSAEPRLCNYHYRWLPRRSGVPRLIEAPKPWLKKLQRRVLHGIVDLIPPHEAAHGFRAGHSPITHARRHVGAAVVLRFDLEDFFASVDAGRVFGIFRTSGYPEQVSHLLTALCTNASARHALGDVRRASDPDRVDRLHQLRSRLATPHLPQGAPTSPTIANLAAFRLDCRLSGLATSLGGSYSRYADDLAISGGTHLAARSASIRSIVRKIVEEEGFRLNERKSQLMTRAGRQRLTGVTVNEHPNVSRATYDRLKALLHEARKHGPERANRAKVTNFRVAVLGEISWVESVNPKRGARLRMEFDRVEW
jgi:hypothetical protein